MTSNLLMITLASDPTPAQYAHDGCIMYGGFTKEAYREIA
jgi:hypothetical protein